MNAKVRESIAIGLFALSCGWIAGLLGEEFFAGVFTVEALGAGLNAYISGRSRRRPRGGYRLAFLVSRTDDQ